MEPTLLRSLLCVPAPQGLFIHLFLNQGLNILHFYLLYLVGGRGCMPQDTYGGQIARFCSPSIICIPGTNLKLPGLAARACTY